MNANQTLQEYADNRGTASASTAPAASSPASSCSAACSKKGREYPQAVMAKALPLYEGMRVNVDHVDPGQRRSLRDRIGLVKNVTLKEDGLYGDFHFNPKHPLAEQIAWDAENAPQNLGFSHDTRGGSRNQGGKVVVESIDKVLSVDLVANPATTTGLSNLPTTSNDMDSLHTHPPGTAQDRTTGPSDRLCRRVQPDASPRPNQDLQEALDGYQGRRPGALQEAIAGRTEGRGSRPGQQDAL